jgi:glycosyltransferase involved in cell wall biosynthesis
MNISIIIPAYNVSEYICETLESILSQIYQPLEIIFVNDGSTDETENVLMPYMKSIRYVRQQNRGLASARNLGLKLAQGQLIQFLDADDLLDPSKISRQAAFFVDNANVDICYCSCIHFEENLQNKKSFFYQKTILGDNPLLQILNINDVFPIPIHSALFRRSVFERVGYFNEGLRSNEDREFWIRIQLQKLLIKHTDFFGVYYRKHAKNMTKNLNHMVEGFIDFNRIATKLIAQNSLYAHDRTAIQMLIDNYSCSLKLLDQINAGFTKKQEIIRDVNVLREQLGKKKIGFLQGQCIRMFGYSNYQALIGYHLSAHRFS